MSQQDNDHVSDDSAAEQPFMSHLFELRDRLMRMVLAVVVVFLALMPFANWLFEVLAGPLTRHLPEGSSMIATQVASPFLIPFKLALVLAIFVAIPVVLYQAWAFIAPGLYQHERKKVLPLLVSSTLLFYLGAAFAYFAVFPLVFGFMANTAPAGVSFTPDIGHYLDFVLVLFFAFGIAFEVPIATVLLVWGGVVTPQTLRDKRPYVVVGAFVIGMLLTPPDIISQTLLAVPMWILYELGIIFSKGFVRKQDEPHGEYEPMTDEEMEAELDRMESDEESSPPPKSS